MRFSRGSSGFTLIELMITVAIIAILASIAMPSYMEHVRRGRRSEGEGQLMNAAQYMERYYTEKMTYVGASVSGFNTDYYEMKLPAGNLNASTFTLQATPRGAQVGDKCGTLSIDEKGVKSPTTSGCW